MGESEAESEKCGNSSPDSDYPTLETTSFDLITIGTALPQSILSSAATSSIPNKTVLHIDPNPFYGSLFSSLSLSSFISLLQNHTSHPSSDTLRYRPLVSSSVDIASHSQALPASSSRSFSLDVSGPRLLFCADPIVDLMLRSGASHHVEFKSLDATLLFSPRSNPQLSPVPDSREAIFKDKTLGLTEKTQLMRFFKLVRSHFDGDDRIGDDDLDTPFVDFLHRQRLPPKIKAMILYAIVMAHYDQEKPETCKKLIRTKDGMQTLALYNSSVGRFPNAVGAFIYPMYGQGELPQAFCRCAAVKGALYILRMPVTALLLDEKHGTYKGVRLASGQDVFSHLLLLDPHLMVPETVLPSNMREYSNDLNSSTKVARAVCIIRGSIRSDSSNLLVVFPPRSLHVEQDTSIRALQLGNNVAVCPAGLFVVYFSTLCDDTILGKEHLRAAINVLFMLPPSENSTSIEYENVEAAKPVLLWSALYVQELIEGFSSDFITSCATPDGNIDYGDLVESTTKLFHKMFPQEELFPEALATENEEDIGSLD